MEIDHSKVMDHVTASKEYWDRGEEKEKLRVKDREEILGLKFKKGQQVRDKVTGEVVEIGGGTREAIAVHNTGVQGSKGIRGEG